MAQQRRSSDAVQQVEIHPPAGLMSASVVRRQATQAARIDTPVQAQAAADLLVRVRQQIKTVKAHYKEIRDLLNDPLRRAKAMEARDLAPLAEADRVIGGAITEWQVRERERQRAESERLLAEATEAAERDRFEQARAIRQAASAAATPEEAQALQRQAEAVIASPVVPVVTAVAARAPQLQGVHTQERWGAVVDNPDLIVLAVVNGTLPLAAVVPNQEWLDQQAVMLASDFNVPGAHAERRVGLVARGRP